MEKKLDHDFEMIVGFPTSIQGVMFSWTVYLYDPHSIGSFCNINSNWNQFTSKEECWNDIIKTFDLLGLEIKKGSNKVKKIK